MDYIKELMLIMGVITVVHFGAATILFAVMLALDWIKNT